MPKPTFFRLPSAKREALVEEAIIEFAERTYAEASLSQIAVRAQIPKGSFYQYFDDKLDLYRWLLTDEVPRRKRAFVGTETSDGDFWESLEVFIERGMAFLVDHPRLARLTAASADTSANADVRGLHQAICKASDAELLALVKNGIRKRAIHTDASAAHIARFMGAIIGPGLTAVVLDELGAELHEVLATDAIRKKLGPKRRKRLAEETVALIRSGAERASGKERKS
jgi:AcrR family transcriptional regulator